MVRLVFSDFDEYVEAMPTIDGQICVTARSQGGWSLDTLDLEGIVVMQGESGAPGIFQGAKQPTCFCVYAPLPGFENRLNGEAIGHRKFGWLTPGSDVQVRAPAPSSFIGLDIAESAWRRHLESEGSALAMSSSAKVGGVPTADGLIATAARALARQAEDPTAFSTATARDHLRTQLLHAVMASHESSTANDARGTSRPASRRRVVRRAIEHIEHCLQTGEPLAGLPRETGVSQRSLNRAFNETFGMSAQLYAGLARLHAIRKQLRSARAGETVTSACTRYGVWDVGRMAGKYQRTFGVAPSEELNRAVHRRR
jgi:AraC family ethanolamine operon transcriptional activator